MAKKIVITDADKREALKQIKRAVKGTGLLAKRFAKLPEEKQLKIAERELRKHYKRGGKVGDWESFFAALMKYLPQLIALLMSFIHPV
jgi:CHAD domain-containing protein